jgi:hypothetical protein
MLKSERCRDLARSLSLSNLMFLRLWLKLLPFRSGSSYVLGYSPFNSYLALMLNVLIWGGLFFLILRGSRRSARAFPWALLALTAVVGFAALYGIGNSLMSLARFAFLFGAGKVVYLEIFLVLSGSVVLASLIRFRAKLVRPLLLLPLLLAPFVTVTFGEAATALWKIEPPRNFDRHTRTAAVPLRNRLATPVVWMIFDETDYRLAFPARPANLSLPAFDGFRNSSLYATRAYSPSDVTQVSLPSLLTGIPLKGTEPVGARRLDLIRADTGARLDFAGQESIFDRIRARKGSSALFGWYHPYSRVLRGVDLCSDYPMYTFFTSDKLLPVLLGQNWELWDVRFLPINNTVIGDNHIRILKRMQSEVLSAVRSQEPSLMFLHYPVPHAPNIYDRSSRKFAFNRSRREGYFDNLALADRCLGELRAEMERKGTWDRAMVVVSSDHHWRTNTYDGKIDFEHVPFMVKFPGQRRGVTYDGKFNTVLTQGLILAYLDGKVKSPEEAERWLDAGMLQGKLRTGLPAQQKDDD